MHYRPMEQLILAQSDHQRVVGSRLRRIIRALGIRQVDAAADMGVTKNHLGNWLRGDAYPLHYQLYKFCRVRGVSADYILLGDPSSLRKELWDALMLQEREPAGPEAADHQEAESGAAA